MTRCSFWTRMDRMPPCIIRLVARSKRYDRLMTVEEIADKAGLSIVQTSAIVQQDTWIGIDLPTARRFMLACRCDVTDRKTWDRISNYVRTAKWKAARQTPNWKTELEPMLQRWLADQRERTIDERKREAATNVIGHTLIQAPRAD